MQPRWEKLIISVRREKRDFLCRKYRKWFNLWWDESYVEKHPHICARETNQLSHKVSLQMHHPSEKDSIKPPSIAHSLRISLPLHKSRFFFINGKDGDYYCAYTYRNASMLHYVQTKVELSINWDDNNYWWEIN